MHSRTVGWENKLREERRALLNRDCPPGWAHRCPGAETNLCGNSSPFKCPGDYGSAHLWTGQLLIVSYSLQLSKGRLLKEGNGGKGREAREGTDKTARGWGRISDTFPQKEEIFPISCFTQPPERWRVCVPGICVCAIKIAGVDRAALWIVSNTEYLFYSDTSSTRLLILNFWASIQ